MVRCIRCRNILGSSTLAEEESVVCPRCDARLELVLFPALLDTKQGVSSAEVLVEEDEAGCFYHPEKKATILCDSCGRFLCSLCDVEFNGEHLCTTCLAAGKKKGKLKNLENQRTLYDSLALSLALYPILFFWVTLFTAPAALFIAIRYWKAPSSIIPRTKIRLVAAILIAGLQVSGWSVFFYNLLT